VRLLLDTHALIWLVLTPDRLSKKVRKALTAPNVEVFASHVSLWEMAIKRRQGKLTELDRPALPWFEHYVSASHVRTMSILPAHLGATESLPLVHGDPFDRLLIAQATVEHLSLVTADTLMNGYDIATLW
jgi:PIN domain nuclease of toxin-antitoxin system